MTVLLLSFGGVGLLLGAVGIYGVLSFLVQQRRSEIGVRIALGARPRDVALSFVRRGLALSGLGIVVGLAGAWMLSQFLTAVLYGVRPTDPVTFAGVAVDAARRGGAGELAARAPRGTGRSGRDVAIGLGTGGEIDRSSYRFIDLLKSLVVCHSTLFNRSIDRSTNRSILRYRPWLARRRRAAFFA